MRLNIFGGLRPFRPREAGRDALAGVTLASMNIPQVLGYTRIAGTPVVTGLYTVLLPLVAFAVFGSSRHLVVAADSATAAIFSSSLVPHGDARQREVYGAGRHGGTADRGVPAAGADLQAGVPRRFPLAHGAGRISDRRRLPGWHRDARRHVRCGGALAPDARSGLRGPAGPAAVQSSDAGVCRRWWPAASCSAIALPAVAGFTGGGRRDDCGER